MESVIACVALVLQLIAMLYFVCTKQKKEKTKRIIIIIAVIASFVLQYIRNDAAFGLLGVVWALKFIE